MSRRLLAHLQQEREGGDLATTLPCTSSICPFPTLQLTCCLQPLGASWPHPDCSSAPASTRYHPRRAHPGPPFGGFAPVRRPWDPFPGNLWGTWGCWLREI